MADVSNTRIPWTIPTLLVVLAIPCVAAVGKTIYVDADGQADFDNIQAGIDNAEIGDTVLVMPGEYVITEPITFRGKAITVRSEAGRDETTIRMGTPADPDRGSIVIFENTETAACVLDGFTITGGKGLWDASVNNWGGGGIADNIADDSISGGSGSGGGVFAWEASPTLIDCIISRNLSKEGIGGGVGCGNNASVTMIHCVITSNTATKCGGGVYANNASANLTNCIITRNTATFWGGGGVMCSYSGAFITISNCTIWGNSGGYSCPPGDELWGGGGVLCRNASATVTNSIVWGNTSPKGSEISVEDPASRLTIACSNVAGGQAGVNVEGGCTLNWGAGNIEAEPWFGDPNEDDFHLKSEAGRWDPNGQTWVQDEATSPCIDRGDPDSDWSAELWSHGGYVNMGAYGGTSQASMSLSDAGNIADLNMDNAVHFADLASLADSWQAEEVLMTQDLDRNGTVGQNDVAALADNWLAEVKEASPLPLAHWKLDESEDSIADDSALDHDGTLCGDPVWQPAGGKIDGALELEGIDDHVSTPFVLNPADGVFSVFAWIKDGMPGQVIISQIGGANWLSADSSEGKLMTNLSAPAGRFPPQPLASESVITDGDWHRVGFTWDGSNRILYVDDAGVARDPQSSLAGSDGGLYIGAGKDRQPGSFFSGLIDDVRIYDRAVTP